MYVTNFFLSIPNSSQGPPEEAFDDEEEMVPEPVPVAAPVKTNPKPVAVPKGISYLFLKNNFNFFQVLTLRKVDKSISITSVNILF